MPTVAIATVLLLQVPPVVVLLRTVVEAAHMVEVPVRAAGEAFTVIDVVVEQPDGAVYVIVVLPAVTPLTIPPDVLTVATEPSSLLQVPPVVPLDSVVVAPSHTTAVPVFAPNVLMVTVAVVEHPDAKL